MCKRKDDDPLLRLFLDRWRLNPLATPREHAEPGDVWLKRGRTVSGPVGLARLLTEPVPLPEPRRHERLAALEGAASRGHSVGASLGLLEAFLTALGAAGVVGELRAGYQRSRASTLSFSFAPVERDSVDPGALGRALIPARLDERHPLAHPDNRLFVAAAVVRSPAVSIVARDERSSGVTLGADILAAINADGAVGAAAEGSGATTYKGRVPLAIGVELYELNRRADGTFAMGLPGSADFRAARATPPRPAFIGDDDEALISTVAPDR